MGMTVLFLTVYKGLIGRVEEILVGLDGYPQASHITIQLFDFLGERHQQLGLPQLRLTERREVMDNPKASCRSFLKSKLVHLTVT
jgi:hypothetical protein